MVVRPGCLLRRSVNPFDRSHIWRSDLDTVRRHVTVPHGLQLGESLDLRDEGGGGGRAKPALDLGQTQHVFGYASGLPRDPCARLVQRSHGQRMIAPLEAREKAV